MPQVAFIPTSLLNPTIDVTIPTKVRDVRMVDALESSTQTATSPVMSGAVVVPSATAETK